MAAQTGIEAALVKIMDVVQKQVSSHFGHVTQGFSVKRDNCTQRRMRRISPSSQQFDGFVQVINHVRHVE